MKIASKKHKGGCLFSLIKTAIVLIVVLAIALYFFTEHIISGAISHVGNLAGVEMRGTAHIVWGECAFSLKDFHIENPDGFLKGDAIRFDEIHINPNPTIASIRGKEAMVIEEIRISGPFLRLEQSGLSNNLWRLKDMFSSLSSGKKSEAKKEDSTKTQTADAESSARKYIIKKVVFENREVAFSAGSINTEAPLPSFTIENLGGTEGGTVTDLSVEILVTLLPRAVDAAKDFALKSGSTKDFLDGANETVNKARDAVESIFNFK